ncbi:MAG: hypothetical protein WC713_00095 [Candidatus Methylomirabilota bacterium]
MRRTAALLPALPWRLGALCGSPASGTEPALTMRLQPERVRQGGVALLTLEAPRPLGSIRILAGAREIPAARLDGGLHAVAWIGVDLETPPGPLAVRVEAATAEGRPAESARLLTVPDGRFSVQRLTCRFDAKGRSEVSVAVTNGQAGSCENHPA